MDYRRRRRIWASLAPTIGTYRPPALRIYRPPALEVVVRRPALAMIEDRRRWHPEGKMAPAATFSRRSQRQVVERIPQSSSGKQALGGLVMPSARIGFKVPGKVAVCVRRKQRREALFALNRTGKGASSRFRKRTQFTNMVC